MEEPVDVTNDDLLKGENDGEYLCQDMTSRMQELG